MSAAEFALRIERKPQPDAAKQVALDHDSALGFRANTNVSAGSASGESGSGSSEAGGSLSGGVSGGLSGGLGIGR